MKIEGYEKDGSHDSEEDLKFLMDSEGNLYDINGKYIGTVDLEEEIEELKQ